MLAVGGCQPTVYSSGVIPDADPLRTVGCDIASWAPRVGGNPTAATCLSIERNERERESGNKLVKFDVGSFRGEGWCSLSTRTLQEASRLKESISPRNKSQTTN